MKILIVIDDYFNQSNGMCISTQRFAHEYRNLGQEVRILSTGKDANYPVPELKINLPFIHSLIEKQGFHFAKPIRKTLKEAVSWADVIQVETPFPVSWRAAKLAKKQNKPVIGTFHIYPQNITASVPILNNQFGNWCFMTFFKVKSFKNCTALQVPTPKAAKWLKKNHFKQKLFIVSNGISEKFIQNPHKEKVGHPFTILCIGRFSHEKRQETLFKAMQLSKHTSEIRLIFAGQGPLEKEYAKLAKQLPKKPIMRYFAPADLKKIMFQTDLVVHCADVEIEGMACMEAFSSGCVPVIADSPLSSTVSYALSENNRFSAGDSRALAQKIDYWFEHPSELIKMRQEYRSYGKALNVARSAKIALGNLENLTLK
ncbi:glycosyltransferase [Lactobacillus acidophilus]